MKIAQISDLHLTKPSWSLSNLFSKRILGNLNWLATRHAAFSEDVLKTLPSFLKDLGVDLLLVGGDLTTTSTQEELKLAKSFIKEFPMQTLVIPGNHDAYTQESERTKIFYDFFQNSPSTLVSKERLKDQRIELHRIAPHFWLIALDTAIATPFYSSRGNFSKEQEELFIKIMETIPKEDKVLVFNHYPFFPQASSRRNLEGRKDLQKRLEEFPQIVLYLHGHTHRHVIANLQPSNLPIVLDSGCLVDQKRGSWNLIDLQEDRCIITAYQYHEQWKPFRQETIEWMR